MRQWLHEFAGMLFIGLGVVLLLANLVHTPVYSYFEAITIRRINGLQPIQPSPFFLGSMGFVMLFPACAAMAAGYTITRQHFPRHANLGIGLSVIEVLIESILVGWMMISSHIPVLFPSAAWGLLTASWLRYFFGPIGSLCIPGVMLYLCRRSKKGLRDARVGFRFMTESALKAR